MRFFITGVAGFLGSHIAEALAADPENEVVGVDNMLGGYRDNVPSNVMFFPADCTNWAMMKTLMSDTDVVYHCAATAYEGLSVFSPSLVSRNIVDASVTVFSAAVANKVKRIVHCSSMARYGTQATPYREDATPMPQDPYGIAKVCAEQMLKNLCDTHGIEYVIAVPHNIIGPRQKYDDPYRNVASIMMNLMLQGKHPTIYGDGSQQRCFSYVADCLQCLVRMATFPVAGEVINIGPDEEPITIQTLYETIANITGYNGDPIYRPGRPQEVHTALCSSDKARKLLNYRTETPLREGLLHMRDWMVKRGTKPFSYHLPLEIITDKTPKTWSEKLF